MELTSVKELYRQTENYADKKVTVGGWLEIIVIPKPSVFWW